MLILPTIFLAYVGRKDANLSCGSMATIVMTSLDLSTDVLFCVLAADEGGASMPFAYASGASLLVSINGSIGVVAHALLTAMRLEREEDHQMNVRSLSVRVAALQLELHEEVCACSLRDLPRRHSEPGRCHLTRAWPLFGAVPFQVRLLVGAREDAPQPPREALGWTERRLMEHYGQHIQPAAEADAAASQRHDAPNGRRLKRPAPGISPRSILDVAAVRASGSYYVSLVLLALTNLELLALLPWRSRIYDGFPTPRLMLLSQASVLLEDVPQLIIQVGYIALVEAKPGSTAGRNLAVPILSIIFTVGSMVHRGLTKAVSWAHGRSLEDGNTAASVAHLNLFSSQIRLLGSLRRRTALLGSGRRSEWKANAPSRETVVRLEDGVDAPGALAPVNESRVNV